MTGRGSFAEARATEPRSRDAAEGKELSPRRKRSMSEAEAEVELVRRRSGGSLGGRLQQ
jgi:hypothetical protein